MSATYSEISTLSLHDALPICPAHLTQLTIIGLHIARAVNGTALQNHRGSIPDPVNVKAGQALVQHRCFQSCCAPVFTAIKRNINALNLAASRSEERRVGKECG